MSPDPLSFPLVRFEQALSLPLARRLGGKTNTSTSGSLENACLNAWQNVPPVQAAISTAERRQSDGTNPEALNSRSEISKARFNIL